MACQRKCSPWLLRKRSYSYRTADILKLTSGAKILQNLPNGAKILQNLPNGTKMLQNLPNGAKILQNLPNGTRILPNLPNGTRILPNLPNGTRILPNLPNSMAILGSTTPPTSSVNSIYKQYAVVNSFGMKTIQKTRSGFYNFLQCFLKGANEIRICPIYYAIIYI